MALGYTPDVNILSAVLKRDHKLIKQLSEIEIFLCPIVLGELFRGAFREVNRPNLLEYARFVEANYPMMSFNHVTCEKFGLIAAKLNPSFKHNDIWIAAYALQYDLIVITRDSDFEQIPEVKFVTW